MEALSIYLHIPFCEHRCGYCDFNTYSGIDHLVPRYVDALLKELSILAKITPISSNYEVQTIFFGGGTPSLLPSILIEKIVNCINNLFSVSSDAEITMEVNPGTISAKELIEVFRIGINRLSIGAQSTNHVELQFLERLHGYQEVCRTLGDARAAGFDNISFDLIYGLPQQRKKVWEKSLRDVLDLQPEHISLYALTIEEGTPLALKVKSGATSEPDPDLAADFYELSSEILKNERFIHYEISNWAKVKECGKALISKHNRQYWINEQYLGIGAGAHGFFGGYRTVNVPSPFKYVQKLNQGSWKEFPTTPATSEYSLISTRREMEETMIMGLRLLNEGISCKRFIDRFGVGLREVYDKEIERLLGKGLVYWGGENGENLLLTNRAYLLANQVFLEFLSD